MKFIFFFVIAVFIFPAVSFAQTSDANDLLVITLLREQIRLLEEIIKVLIAGLAVSQQPASVQPVTVPVAAPPKSEPLFDLKADGSDGPVTIKKGESVNLSWILSDHSWSYCNKFFGWDGGFKPVNGSEVSGPISYGATFKVICYFDSRAIEDSVVIKVIEPETVAVSSPTLAQTASSTFALAPGGGFIGCFLEATPQSATMGKDAIEATWVIDSDPRQAFFYWRGKDNGVDIGKVYGGKTQRIRLFDYPSYPAKYERYVETFFSQDHLVGDPYAPGCTTKTVTFEVK